MPDLYPSPRFRPWRWRLRPSSPPLSTGDARPAIGWVSVYLTRRPKPFLLRPMYDLRPPTVLASAAAATPPPPRVYLQAVNRSSTF